jgi:uncharacterized protein (DUF1800 family)
MNAALRALNRFGLGARPGEAARLSDARGWLRAQLDGGAPALAAPAGITSASIGTALRNVRMQNGSERDRMEARRRLVEIGASEAAAALTARVSSDRPYVERLVAFWSNHLCISAGAKVIVAPLAGSYEREAIRPHVLGRFADMVLASAQHPAMLTYLDNFQSIGPASPAARAGRRPNVRGLNENYARELLELHTLGVNGGYTQQDVQELARLLTGWTVRGLGQGVLQRPAREEGSIGFGFEPQLHEPGSKTVLGVRYGEGVREGERAIRALCAHPSTARFIATKLVTHFVADDPPAAAVDRIADVFGSTDGDLRAVAAALIELPEAWSATSRKFRSPQDWLVALFRAADVNRVTAQVAPLLRQLRQPLWSPQSPKGFGDALQDWADPDSLLNRAELARTLARRAALGIGSAEPRALAAVVDIERSDPLHDMLGDGGTPAAERIALAFAGPAFQWR